MGNLRHPITQTPLPGTKKAYGQLLSRDFNPLDIPPITANGLTPLVEAGEEQCQALRARFVAGGHGAPVEQRRGDAGDAGTPGIAGGFQCQAEGLRKGVLHGARGRELGFARDESEEWVVLRIVLRIVRCSGLRFDGVVLRSSVR